MPATTTTYPTGGIRGQDPEAIPVLDGNRTTGTKWTGTGDTLPGASSRMGTWLFRMSGMEISHQPRVQDIFSRYPAPLLQSVSLPVDEVL